MGERHEHAEKYPRVAGGPFREWTRAIKGEDPEPGSNFEGVGVLRKSCCSAL